MNNELEHGHEAYVPQRENTKVGFWVFLSGEVILFGVLIGSFLLFKSHHADEFAEATAGLSIPLIALNTFILIFSSFMVVSALEALRNGSLKGLRNNLIAVLVLGALFLGGQAFEWMQLYNEGIWFDSAFGTPFLTTTGIHGSHVFIGLLWVIFILLGIRKNAYSKTRFHGVEVFGLYWHFVDVVWIVLFTVFYLL